MTENQEQSFYTLEDIAIEWYVRNHFIGTLPRWGWSSDKMASFFAPKLIRTAICSNHMPKMAALLVGEWYIHPRYIDRTTIWAENLSEEWKDRLFPRLDDMHEELAVELASNFRRNLEAEVHPDLLWEELVPIAKVGRILLDTREDQSITDAVHSSSLALSVWPLILERAWKKGLHSDFWWIRGRGPSLMYHLLRNSAVLQDSMQRRGHAGGS